MVKKSVFLQYGNTLYLCNMAVILHKYENAIQHQGEILDAICSENVPVLCCINVPDIYFPGSKIRPHIPP